MSSATVRLVAPLLSAAVLLVPGFALAKVEKTSAVSCATQPDALATQVASLDRNTNWYLLLQGTCTGDVDVSGFNSITFASDPAAATPATIAGSVVVTLTNKFVMDGVNIAVTGGNLGMLCGGLSTCYLNGATITGGGPPADGVIVTGRSRATLAGTSIDGFRIGLYVNNGASAGFAATGPNPPYEIRNMSLDAVYAIDGAFVTVEGAGGSRARLTNLGRSGITALNASIRLRTADVVSVGTAGAGYAMELRSGATAHVQNATLSQKPSSVPGAGYPPTGGAWPSVLLADLSHLFFVDGGTVGLAGPIHCKGNFSSYDSFLAGALTMPTPIGCPPVP